MGLDGVIVVSRWWSFGCNKPTRKGFILIPPWFGRIVGVWMTMDDPLVALVGLWKAPCKRDSRRGLGSVFGGFERLPVFLFLVVEKLPVGSNSGCIFGLWASHYIAIKFATIRAFIVA